MTVPATIDAGAWLSKYLEGTDGDHDLARAMLAAFAEALMSAQASMQCGALWRAHRGAGELPQRLPDAALVSLPRRYRRSTGCYQPSSVRSGSGAPNHAVSAFR